VVACFRDDFEACIAHLRFPLQHRKVIRTTNLLERLFLEERRRTKIILVRRVCSGHTRGGFLDQRRHEPLDTARILCRRHRLCAARSDDAHHEYSVRPCE
jgi:hypothetical protein